MHRFLFNLLTYLSLTTVLSWNIHYAEAGKSNKSFIDSRKLLLSSYSTNHSDETKLKRSYIRNLDEDLRNILKDCNDVLPTAARNQDGKPVSLDQINQNTIFVRPIINEGIEQKLLAVDGKKLYRLLKIARFLDMELLVNAFSYCIAKRIESTSCSGTKSKEDLKKCKRNLTKCLETEKDLPKYLLRKNQFGSFDKEELIYIKKHLYLIRHKKTEQTIGDYIGLDGQPPILDHQIDLSKKDLTSTYGIHLIKHPKKVRKIDLQGNFLLGPDMDPNFPSKPFKSFTQLQSLNLSNNQLATLPKGCFNNYQHLRYIYLDNNKLTTLPNRLFYNLIHLKELRLDHNQLKLLPEHLFYSSMIPLKELYLNNNQLETLPIGLFSNTIHLEWLYLDHNQIKSLPEGIFKGLKDLDHLYLNNNQLKSLSIDLFTDLKSLDGVHLEDNPFSFGEFEKGKKEHIKRTKQLSSSCKRISYIVTNRNQYLQRLPRYHSTFTLVPTDFSSSDESFSSSSDKVEE